MRIADRILCEDDNAQDFESVARIECHTFGFVFHQEIPDRAFHCCPVVELRQYTLHPGTRDTLIALFDREFVESQEDVGIEVIAQFRDIDRPDVFTWLRGFPSMSARATALRSFYDGPVWARHCDAANATMIDWHNVRLLRPVRPSSGITVARNRPGLGTTVAPPGVVVVTVYSLAHEAANDFPQWFDAVVAPQLIASAGRPIARLETELSPNTFPRLPVREGEDTFVWMARFDDVAAYDRHVSALIARPRWAAEIRPALGRYLTAPAEVLRLRPTLRSRLLL